MDLFLVEVSWFALRLRRISVDLSFEMC